MLELFKRSVMFVTFAVMFLTMGGESEWPGKKVAREGSVGLPL